MGKKENDFLGNYLKS